MPVAVIVILPISRTFNSKTMPKDRIERGTDRAGAGDGAANRLDPLFRMPDYSIPDSIHRIPDFMPFFSTIANRRYVFDSLRELLAKATPPRSGDVLAGIAAQSAEERVAAQFALADLPLTALLSEPIIPYEEDEVTRLIVDTHDAQAFAPIRSFTVGELRDWLLSDEATAERTAALAPGLTPEMAAAVSKLMRLQDLVLAAAKIRVITRFRTTVGLPGRLSARLQPNHPTDDPLGIAASILDG